MSLTLDLSDRLTAMDIDAPTCASLRELRPLVAAHIDEAIDAAFAQIMRFPEVQRLYRSISLDNAKSEQRRHWLDDLFAGTFSDAQLANSVAMVERRRSSGLALRWYFVFWTIVFARLQDVVTHANRKRPDRLPTLLAALSKVVLFDIEIFTAVYVHATEDAATTQLNQHADGFEREVSGLVKALAASTTQLHNAAQGMSTGAEHTAEQARAAMTAGEQTGGNAQAVATTTEQLAASIQEIGRQVAQSTKIAGTAVDEAQRTDALVRGLVEAGSRIGDVVKLIKDIASQTNLLALDATIEAARAGEAGKGFAVVAGEVKNLANQTGKATDEISAQITAVQKATQDAVSAIQGIGATIAQISEIASAIASAVDQQRSATQEIAQNVQEVARSSGAANSSIAAVTTSAEQTGSAAKQVVSGLDALTRQSDQLSGQVDQFLGKIRRTG